MPKGIVLWRVVSCLNRVWLVEPACPNFLIQFHQFSVAKLAVLIAPTSSPLPKPCLSG